MTGLFLCRDWQVPVDPRELARVVNQGPLRWLVCQNSVDLRTLTSDYRARSARRLSATCCQSADTLRQPVQIILRNDPNENRLIQKLVFLVKVQVH